MTLKDVGEMSYLQYRELVDWLARNYLFMVQLITLPLSGKLDENAIPLYTTRKTQNKVMSIEEAMKLQRMADKGR